jgi:hypothetical protein
MKIKSDYEKTDKDYLSASYFLYTWDGINENFFL